MVLIDEKKKRLTKLNPWKSWPDKKPCFCGCGRLTKKCRAKHLMPMWITVEDQLEAQKDMEGMLAYVDTLLAQGSFYKDIKASNILAEVFIRRDNPDAFKNDGASDKRPGLGRDSSSNNGDGKVLFGSRASKFHK